MSRREQLMATLRERHAEVDVNTANALQRNGAVLLDVREATEWAEGSPVGAVRLARSQLEFEVEKTLPDPDRPVLLLCQAGARALLCAEALQSLGYTRLQVVSGGYRAWKQAQLPVEIPPGADAEWRRRYARQIVLPEVGLEGQQRLARARVLLIGAGGLGSPVALYLAAAGVGTLRLVDDDVVDASNLQRQVLHTTARVGRPKVQSAAETLCALNPAIKLELQQCRVSSANVDMLLADCDLVIDGSDNLATRYLLSDAAVVHAKPLIYGAVERFFGQVSVFHPGSARGQAPCYRCLYPEPPPPEHAPNCAEVGVLGVMPGVIGLLQATEALKLLLGVGQPLVGRLLLYDALAGSFRELALRADPACSVCAPGQAFPGYIDYAAFCAAQQAPFRP